MCTTCGCQKKDQELTAETPQELSAENPTAVSRRTAIIGAGGLGAGTVLLSACGSTDAETLTESDGRPAEPTDMAATSDIPVGGVIQATAKGSIVMISQPTEGVFHAFSSVCTHQGCQLKALKEKSISCPCHSSVFSLEDGSVQGGPAEAPLTEFPVEIKDGRIWVG